jgi:hypothetical protein
MPIYPTSLTCIIPQPIGKICLREIRHRGPCDPQPMPEYRPTLRVWVLVAKNAEGEPIVFEDRHYPTREAATDRLGDLAYRVAKSLCITMLAESKE